MENGVKKILPIALIMGIVISLAPVSHSAVLISYFRPKRNVSDTAIPDYFPTQPFTYAMRSIILPYSLGGRKYNANIAVSVWVDSCGNLLSIYPKRITLYKKGSENPKNRVKEFKDSNWGTPKWENITPEAKRYIEWIKQLLPHKIGFIRVRYPLASGRVYSPPVKSRNWVGVTVHAK